MVMHPVRLVVTKEACLAFDPADPAVRAVVEDVAATLKIVAEEQVCVCACVCVSWGSGGALGWKCHDT
jgi:hypothetical protein